MRPQRERGLYEKDPGSGVWWIRWTDQNGVLRRERVGTKSMARDVLEKRRQDLRAGRFFPERAQRDVRLEDWVPEYLERAQGTLRDGRHRKLQLEAWTEALGSRKLRALTPGDVERFLGRLRAAGRKPATVRQYLASLRRCLNVALADGLLDRNPAARIKLEPLNNARTRWLTPEETEKLLAELPPFEQDCVRFAIHTGMRQSEQFGLRWRNVGIDGLAVRVEQSKTGEGRWVRLNAVAQQILELRRREAPTPGDRIFPGNTDTVRDRFARAAARAGLEDVRWHDLRHTFASRLVMAGVPLRTVQELLGHKTPMMTLRYAHLAPGHLQDAVELLATDTKTDTKGIKTKKKDQGQRA